MSDVEKSAAGTPSQSDSQERAEFLGSIVTFVEFRCKDPRKCYQELKELAERQLAQLEAAGGARQPALMEETMTQPTETPTALEASPPIQLNPLEELLAVVVDDPETWLATPSVQLGGRRPGDLIGTDEEHKVVSLLQAVDQGLF
jgi:hypothetical protein